MDEQQDGMTMDNTKAKKSKAPDYPTYKGGGAIEYVVTEGQFQRLMGKSND